VLYDFPGSGFFHFFVFFVLLFLLGKRRLTSSIPIGCLLGVWTFVIIDGGEKCIKITNIGSLLLSDLFVGLRLVWWFQT